jgi:hypothetical protein
MFKKSKRTTDRQNLVYETNDKWSKTSKRFGRNYIIK